MSADVTAARACPRCDFPLQDDDVFCEGCGLVLERDPQVAAAAAAAARPEVAGAGAVGRAQAEAGEEIGGVDADSVHFDAAVNAGPPRRPGVVVTEPDLDTVVATCPACSGSIAPDGYCEQCGTPAPRPRDHWVEQPAPWVALACDRGIRHAINQDGAAVAARPEPGSFAALVVCDGVSSAARSEAASLAAARAARDVLAAPRRGPALVPAGLRPAAAAPPTPAPDTVPVRVPPEAPDLAPVEIAEQPDREPGDPEPESDLAPVEIAEPTDRQPTDREPADPEPKPAPREDPGEERPVGSSAAPSQASLLAAAMREAGAAAQERAVAVASDPPEHNPPACTFAAAVIDESVLVAGWVGDSRVYWLPDDGPPAQLSEDDSLAGEAIRLGLPRAEAERSPHAHSITRWLGVDAPDPQPRTAVRRIDGPAWVLVCSDGLWNYCSEATAMRDLVGHTAGQVGQDVAQTAEGLVTWAIEQGGHDNIAVVLARLG